MRLEWSFGDRIRKIRRALGLNQGEFAASISAGPKAVGAWELGTNTPSDAVSIAKRIQMRYGVPAVWTLGLNDESPRPDGPDGGLSSDGLPQLDSNQQPAGYRPRRTRRVVRELPQWLPQLPVTPLRVAS